MNMRIFFLALACACGTPKTAAVTLSESPVDASAPRVVSHAEDDFPCGAYAPDGFAPDAMKARACLERANADGKTTCDGGSPPLALLELAVSLADGAGGPADPERALSLLKGCFADVSVQAVALHIQKRDAPFRSCDAFAQTTLASSECLAEHTDNERLWIRFASRRMSPERAALFTSAAKTYDAYATDVGAIAYARFEGGTMRDPAMRATTLALLRRRHARIAKLLDVGEIPPAVDVANAESNAERALENARANADHDVLTAIAKANDAWPAYRDAEIALYENVRAGSRDAAHAAIEVERFADFCDAP
jgi:hypothetical protein